MIILKLYVKKSVLLHKSRQTLVWWLLNFVRLFLAVIAVKITRVRNMSNNVISTPQISDILNWEPKCLATGEMPDGEDGGEGVE